MYRLQLDGLAVIVNGLTVILIPLGVTTLGLV